MAGRAAQEVAAGHRFVRAWLALIDGPAAALDGVAPELAALAAAVDARGPQRLELARVVIEAPSTAAIAAARARGERVAIGAGERGRYEVDPASGEVWTVSEGGATRSFDSLDDLIATNHSRKRDEIGLAAQVDRIETADAWAAAAPAASGGVRFEPVAEVPPPIEHPDRAPDGRRLSCHPVRTRAIDPAGVETIMLEGWYQLGAAWLDDGTACVLCRGGEVSLDREDPEVAGLAALESFPGRDRLVRVTSAPLLHVVGDSELRYHIAVDADRVQSTPDGALVVLTRGPRPGAGRWRTAVLGSTPAGLAMLAKHELDVGDLRASGDRVFGSFAELVGAREARAAAGSWRLERIGDSTGLEQAPPPPPGELAIGDALALVRAGGALDPVEPPDTGAIWTAWPQVLGAARTGEDTCWVLVRLHLAHAELARMTRRGGEWRVASRLPVEGFDRVYASGDGSLLALTINNAPSEMARTVWLEVDPDSGELRYRGRLDRAVTGVSGDRVELLGGHVYRLRQGAPADPDPRRLRAVVFDVPGHYGVREFLPRYDHDVGFIDRDGSLAIDHRFTSALDFDAGRCRAAHCGPRLFGLIDRDGGEVLGHHYNWIGEDRGGLRAIGRGAPDICGRRPGEATWGLARSADGAIVLAPAAEVVRDASEGRAAVRRDGRWNLIDGDGRWLLESDARGCGDFSGGLCAVAPGDRWGFIDAAGDWAIEPRFEAVGQVCDGRIAARLAGGAWRLADAAGALLGDRGFDQLGQHHEGRSRARVGDRWGYVDASGELVIDPRFDDAWDFRDGIAAVRMGDRWSWIDRGGRLLADPGYTEVFSSRDGHAVFRDGARSGIIAASGAVIASGFEAAYGFCEGLALVRQRARWGFIDTAGAPVIAPRFSEALAFSEGLAAARCDGTWGFIDPTGAWAIEPHLGTCGSFRDGRAAVHR